MPKNLKILAIVSGYGLGNSQRTHLYLTQKEGIQNSEITVIASNNSFEYFSKQENQIFCRSFKLLEQIQLDYKIQGFIVFELLKLILIQFPISIRNGFFQLKALLNSDFDFILIDSDYSAWIWRLFCRAEVIVINSSPLIIKFKPKKLSLQFFFEWLEFYYFYIISNIIICPVLEKFDELDSIKIKTWLCRTPELKLKQLKSTPNTILVIQGGTLQNEWAKILKQSDDWLNNYQILILGTEQIVDTRFRSLGRLWGKNKYFHIQNADILLIHGGFSSVMESLSCQIPTLCLPLTNHHEQWVNANEGLKTKNFRVTNSHSALRDLKQMIKEYSSYG
jgi:hypothetical protein